MRKHILVVDDDPALCLTNVLILKRAGYNVTQAQDGEEALEMIIKAYAEDKPYDLLMTDIQMPRMSGIELIHELKKRDISLPIVAVSGLCDEEIINYLLTSGCSDFIRKPYDIEELIEQVNVILGQEQKEMLRPPMSMVGMA